MSKTLEDFNLNDIDKNSLLERLKDLKVSNPSTTHPIDFYLLKMGLVSIKNGSTTYIGK